MKRNTTTILILALACLAYLLAVRKVSAATNISAAANLHWAWNDVIGWFDHYTTNTVFLTAYKMQGFASSTGGAFSFDCATSADGNVCDTSNYGVVNDENGNLTGWAWNDAYGWVSFCGGAGTNNCPGSVVYQVKVNMGNGVFSGYAWNDILGWISYNCADPGTCGSVLYEVAASSSAAMTGYLDSTPYDTGVQGGAQINSVSWKGTLPLGTGVYFQIAASNSASGPWDFKGPQGTSNDYYGPVPPSTSYKMHYTLHNNKRYFKYRLTLYTDSFQFTTPTVDEVNINWSP